MIMDVTAHTLTLVWLPLVAIVGILVITFYHHLEVTQCNYIENHSQPFHLVAASHNVVNMHYIAKSIHLSAFTYI